MRESVVQKRRWGLSNKPNQCKCRGLLGAMRGSRGRRGKGMDCLQRVVDEYAFWIRGRIVGMTVAQD